MNICFIFFSLSAAPCLCECIETSACQCLKCIHTKIHDKMRWGLDGFAEFKGGLEPPKFVKLGSNMHFLRLIEK